MMKNNESWIFKRVSVKNYSELQISKREREVGGGVKIEIGHKQLKNISENFSLGVVPEDEEELKEQVFEGGIEIPEKVRVQNSLVPF